MVVEESPEQLREAAICFFREEELPEPLWSSSPTRSRQP